MANVTSRGIIVYLGRFCLEQRSSPARKPPPRVSRVLRRGDAFSECSASRQRGGRGPSQEAPLPSAFLHLPS